MRPSTPALRCASASGVLALLASAGLAASQAAAAPGPESTLPLTQEEVYNYISSVYDAINACDAGWFEQQLAPSATVQFLEVDGRTRALTPRDYVEGMRAYCAPFQYIRWDRTASVVEIDGPRAGVRWSLWWGGTPAAPGESALVIEDRMELVRHGWGLRIAAIEDRFQELVPGAQRVYWATYRSDTAVDRALRMYRMFVKWIMTDLGVQKLSP